MSNFQIRYLLQHSFHYSEEEKFHVNHNVQSAKIGYTTKKIGKYIRLDNLDISLVQIVIKIVYVLHKLVHKNQ